MDWNLIFAALIGALVGGVATTIVGNLISAQFTGQRQEVDIETQYQLVAIKERMQAAQEGYRLFYQYYIERVDSEYAEVTVANLVDWWAENCLYLPTNFRRTIHDSIYKLVNIKAGKNDKDKPITLVVNALKLFEESVHLVSIKNPFDEVPPNSI